MVAIHIVGAGGIGCALGHALLAAAADVTFVEANPDKVRWGNRHGVALAGQSAAPARFVEFAEWQPPPSAIVLLCTKCYDNETVLARLGNTETLVPVQNGFDSRLLASGHQVEGIASFVSECEADRPLTRITRPGELHLGPARERSAATDQLIQSLRHSLRHAPFPIRVVSDIRPWKHTKLLYNAAIGPLAAAAGIDNGALLRHPKARRLFFTLLQENHAILQGANRPLGKIGPLHPATVARILARPWLANLLARWFEPSLRGTYCSMAHDLPQGRTELGNYTGYLLQLAGSTPCPLSRRLHDLVRRMERERRSPSLQVLDELSGD